MNVTPLECFVAGVAVSLFLGAAFFLFGWWRLAVVRQRADDPSAAFWEKSALSRALPPSMEEDTLQLRRREVELMERILERQEVMIDLLRQSQSERVLP